MNPFCYNHLDRRINMCAVTASGKQFIQLQQLNKDIDIILILNFAIDYLHFVF